MLCSCSRVEFGTNTDRKALTTQNIRTLTKTIVKIKRSETNSPHFIQKCFWYSQKCQFLEVLTAIQYLVITVSHQRNALLFSFIYWWWRIWHYYYWNCICFKGEKTFFHEQPTEWLPERPIKIHSIWKCHPHYGSVTVQSRVCSCRLIQSQITRHKLMSSLEEEVTLGVCACVKKREQRLCAT